jgi:hypothetical protein
MDHRKSAGANSNRNDRLYVSIFFISSLDNSNVYYNIESYSTSLSTEDNFRVKKHLEE